MSVGAFVVMVDLLCFEAKCQNNRVMSGEKKTKKTRLCINSVSMWNESNLYFIQRGAQLVQH